MKRKEILDSLKFFLPSVKVAELDIVMENKGDVGICLTIHDIIRGYKSTQESEDRVCELLSQLCKIHFG